MSSKRELQVYGAYAASLFRYAALGVPSPVRSLRRDGWFYPETYNSEVRQHVWKDIVLAAGFTVGGLFIPPLIPIGQLKLVDAIYDVVQMFRVGFGHRYPDSIRRAYRQDMLDTLQRYNDSNF